MNQKSRQQPKNSVEKFFYKLMNNSNFGYDCREQSQMKNIRAVLSQLLLKKVQKSI